MNNLTPSPFSLLAPPKGSDLCYFSALRRCCGNSLREAVPVSGSDVVSFGDENKIFINVTFNLVGGLCSGEEVGKDNVRGSIN